MFVKCFPAEVELEQRMILSEDKFSYFFSQVELHLIGYAPSSINTGLVVNGIPYCLIQRRRYEEYYATAYLHGAVVDLTKAETNIIVNGGKVKTKIRRIGIDITLG